MYTVKQQHGAHAKFSLSFQFDSVNAVLKVSVNFCRRYIVGILTNKMWEAVHMSIEKKSPEYANI
jgi:hypothetical protein